LVSFTHLALSEEKPIAGIDLKELAGLAGKDLAVNKKLIKRLKRRKPKDLDEIIHEQHHHQFEHIDCLECANCCKTTPALLEQKDISRISRHLGMTAGTFITQYVVMDEDGDFVFNSSPCPLLGSDNYCSVYDVRPAACAEYPHTARKGQRSILNLSLQNTKVCPAVYRIFQELSSVIDYDNH